MKTMTMNLGSLNVCRHMAGNGFYLHRGLAGEMQLVFFDMSEFTMCLHRGLAGEIAVLCTMFR